MLEMILIKYAVIPNKALKKGLKELNPVGMLSSEGRRSNDS
jgi:hypothetical protein